MAIREMMKMDVKFEDKPFVFLDRLVTVGIPVMQKDLLN